MPKRNVSIEDLHMMFCDSLCLYNNKPYYIENISGEGVAHCLDLFTQRWEEIEMDETTFQNPTMRLGFINLMGSVVYMARTTPRKYKVGLCQGNVQTDYIHGISYPHGEGATMRKAATMQCIEMADAMYNKYPTIPEVIDIFRKGNIRALAIDHQFALSFDGYVYYKHSKVGKWTADSKTAYDLQFEPEYKYLITLLDNNHEKSI